MLIFYCDVICSSPFIVYMSFGCNSINNMIVFVVKKKNYKFWTIQSGFSSWVRTVCTTYIKYMIIHLGHGLQILKSVASPIWNWFKHELYASTIFPPLVLQYIPLLPLLYFHLLRYSEFYSLESPNFHPLHYETPLPHFSYSHTYNQFNIQGRYIPWFTNHHTIS